MTNTTKFARTSALIALASSLLAITAPAFAASNDDPLPQGTVNIAGTDFTSVKAVDHLKARVRRVAFEICVPNASGAVIMAPDERKCYETALTNGLTQIASKQQEALRATTVNMASAQGETHSNH
jgi:UrcA family protein